MLRLVVTVVVEVHGVVMVRAPHSSRSLSAFPDCRRYSRWCAGFASARAFQ